MAPAHQTISHRSMLIAGFSTVVEWYDFTLYIYVATILSRVMFGGGEGSLAAVLAGFAVSYLMRPLGALAMGHYGDRHGRRRAMLLSMAVMTAAMLACALLPTYAMIGPAAGLLLLALRCVMAFAVGGEYTGVVAYLIEGAGPRRRGLITSCASAASEVGALLAVGVAAVTAWALPAEVLDSWGWRIPFLVGALLAGGVLMARANMDESPEFERQRAAGTVPANPLRHAITHQRAGIVRGFAISALGSISYYVGITYVPAFLASVGAVSEGAGLALSTVAALVVIVVTPLVGALSDHVGRRPVLIGIALACAAGPITLFTLMAHGGVWPALVGAVLLAALGGAWSAVGAVATAEQFSGEARLSGLALGVTSATAVFGGLTPWIAQHLLEVSQWPAAPGAMIAVVAAAILPVLWRIPETAPMAGWTAEPQPI
ncbi:MAG: MFS transporter [Novosphingobium sp.]|uniref:MFS transporter n=1 Tax=Novosphingobium sp. TaxID=1874826 RepID=UPI003015973C